MIRDDILSTRCRCSGKYKYSFNAKDYLLLH